jgi:hypothetical protein
MNSKTVKISSGVLAGILAPCLAHACACGCGIFDVGGSTMLPEGPGGMVWTEFDYMNQNRNWAGSSKGSPDDNGDKRLQTEFTMIGAQYMFNSAWGIEGQIPYTFRYFKGTDDNGDIATHSWSGLGDIHINAIYTGFSDDLSTGLTLGLKLPTGRFNVDRDLVDRDTQIGTGSTDILLGGFHRGKIGRGTHLEWFVSAQLDMPLLTQDQYRPGVEFDSALGMYYTGFSIGRARIIPLAQVLFSERSSDSEANADSENTGYQRVLLSPGLEVHIHPVKIYADAEFPVYQNFTGNQLAAPVLLKFSVSYMF